MPCKPTGRPPGRPKNPLTARQVREKTKALGEAMKAAMDEGMFGGEKPTTFQGLRNAIEDKGAKGMWSTVQTQQGDPIPDGYEPFAAFQDAMTTMIVSRRKV